MDVIYRFDPELAPAAQPATAEEATKRLRRGNEEFVRLCRANLESHEVWSVSVDPRSGATAGLTAAPSDQDEFNGLGRRLVESERVRALLGD